MAISEAKKRADAKWHKANTKQAACTLSLEEHAAFKSWAEQRGLTVSGALLAYIRDCISTEQQPSAPQAPEQPPRILTRDEVIALASVRGKDAILEAVSQIDEADAKNYLMWILIDA